MTIVVTGAGGMLGQAVVKAAKAVEPSSIGFTRDELDVTDKHHLSHGFRGITGPITIINCAGIVRGDRNTTEGRRWLVNAVAPRDLVRRCARLVQVSTDCVFSGDPQDGWYYEHSEVSPIDWYGRSKLWGEIAYAPHVTVRGSFIGFESGLLAWFMAQAEGAILTGYADHIWSGGYVADYADALVAIAQNPKLTGIAHLVTQHPQSKYNLLRDLRDALRPDLAITSGLGPEGPRHLDLRSTRAAVPRLPSWGAALRRMHRDHQEPKATS